MKTTRIVTLLSVILLQFPSSRAMAWAEQGHHIICEAATRLVSDATLRTFLRSRNHQLGHVCNIADIAWKNTPPATPISNAAHYIDPERFGVTIDQIPLAFPEMVRLTQLTPELAAEKMGSLWWRAEQFQRRGVAALKAAAAAPVPASTDAQNADHPYNAAVYEFLTAAGALGHFVGDTTMPWHNTEDYDGYGRGHGGIHGFYEAEVVNTLDLGLVGKVVEEGKRLQTAQTAAQQTVSSASLMERLRRSSTEAVADMPALLELDTLLEPSTVTVDAAGLTVRKPAKRPPVATVAASMEPIVIAETARAALLLAQIMDGMRLEAGEVNLAPYRSYRYPLNPEFVEPDYVKAE